MGKKMGRYEVLGIKIALGVFGTMATVGALLTVPILVVGASAGVLVGMSMFAKLSTGDWHIGRAIRKFERERLEKAVEDEMIEAFRIAKQEQNSNFLWAAKAHERDLEKIGELELFLTKNLGKIKKDLGEHLDKECVAYYWDEGKIEMLKEILGGKSG